MPLSIGLAMISGSQQLILERTRKYDAMAARNGQTYDFIFVHSDGRQLAEASEILAGLEVHPSVDGVYVLEDVNAALQKVAGGGSRGKTVIHIK